MDKPWKKRLPELEGLPLIPCGAGAKGKAPVDHRTGKGLDGWQKAAYTPAQIDAMNGVVKCVGTRCGPEADHLCILDIDGQTALDLCHENNCDPDEAGWVIERNNATDRLKVAFRIEADLLHHLHDGQGQPIGKRVLTTKPATYQLDADGNPERDVNGRLVPLTPAEQLELFYASGQCIVLGDHLESGGEYRWRGTPEQVAAPTPEWWGVLVKVLEAGAAEAKASQPKGSGTTVQSGPKRPCPICGRNTSGACTTYIDGDRERVNCFDGQTFSFRQTVGDPRKGQKFELGGTTWAFTGYGFNNAIGGFGTFVEDRPREQASTNVENALAAVDPGAISSLDDLLGCAEEGKLRRPRKDKLTAAISMVLPLEFNQLTGRIENNGSEVEGDFLSTLYLQLAEKFQLDVSKDAASDAALVAARRRGYHPVRDYLNGLNTQLSKADWEQIAHRCFDSVSGPAQLFLQRQLIGLVARALDPGCKLDTALVIHSSRQGIGKSTFWSLLGGDWFSDSLGNLSNLKDDIITLHSAWIHEWGEIDSVMGKRESEALKKFLSARRDDVRKPYGRGIESLQRSCGIVGTTNRDDFIKDPTGNRRFPVFSVQQVNLDWVDKNRDAIWGSALAAYRNGDHWHYSHDENELITQTAAQFAADDPIFDAVQTWIEDNPEKKEVCTPVLVHFINHDRLNDRELGRQVGNVLRRLGWERSRQRARGYLPNGNRHNAATVWIRPESS